MPALGWWIAIVVVAVLLTMWLTFTATRLDRLHARVDAAQAALDAQLVRRAAALQHLLESVPADDRREGWAGLARSALEPERDLLDRRTVENEVSRAVRDLADARDAASQGSWPELREASARVLISRRFYNDAVRDTRALRARRMPRLLRMAGRRALPEFFDIDDTPPPPAETTPRHDIPGSPGGRPSSGTVTKHAPTTEEDRP